MMLGPVSCRNVSRERRVRKSVLSRSAGVAGPQHVRSSARGTFLVTKRKIVGLSIGIGPRRGGSRSMTLNLGAAAVGAPAFQQQGSGAKTLPPFHDAGKTKKTKIRDQQGSSALTCNGCACCDGPLDAHGWTALR